jgi:hypothetical protein
MISECGRALDTLELQPALYDPDHIAESDYICFGDDFSNIDTNNSVATGSGYIIDSESDLTVDIEEYIDDIYPVARGEIGDTS